MVQDLVGGGGGDRVKNHFLQEPSICRHFDSLPLIFCSSGPQLDLSDLID